MSFRKLEKLAQLIRYWILFSTTEANSGHLTSSLSAVELMTALFFGSFFKFDLKNPDYFNNDRLIFSKGHATPLLYALFAAAGVLSEKDLKNYRKFSSVLEGHPRPVFPYVEVATGSLGQGLSIGVGMALNSKYLDKLSYKTFVLLGDSEMSEGSQWEAIQIASYYKLDNLIGIIDVNRLGQRGETMYGHNLKAYQKRISAFGWQTILINGHSFLEIITAYKKATTKLSRQEKPIMIIAKTIKGKGISFLEDKDNWHGKALSSDQFKAALAELGKINFSVRGKIAKPKRVQFPISNYQISNKYQIEYSKDEPVATRKAYGNALVRIFPKCPKIVVLDAEVSNSTFAETFKKVYPEKFFEMYIAEQNMVGVALGLSKRGKVPFISSFAAFLTRAFDQIRMSQYSKANIKFIGSHAGVSVGEDGPSQMGLEDIAMFRALLNSIVLYPADAISTEKLVEAAAKKEGMVYIRTTRKDTPLIYDKNEKFAIGKSKVLKESRQDLVTVVAAGITLHQALDAYKELKKEGILIRVIDLYSIKPIDKLTLKKAAKETKALLVVEDHFLEGGIAEATRSVLFDCKVPIYSLAVKKIPKSGKPEELLDYEEISIRAIVKKIKEIRRYLRMMRYIGNTQKFNKIEAKGSSKKKKITELKKEQS